ncbi:MAG TPA: hypothetical protein PKU69_02300 [Bacillota bacterium]|nr:hypothetical protein [Bacillota bacterium]
MMKNKAKTIKSPVSFIHPVVSSQGTGTLLFASIKDHIRYTLNNAGEMPIKKDMT